MIGAASLFVVNDVTSAIEFPQKYPGTTGLNLASIRMTGRRFTLEQQTPAPIPNVTGLRQAKCIDFADDQPDSPQPSILNDVEAPGDEETPVETVDGSPARCDNVPGMVWASMSSSDIISGLIRDLQPHDRDDIRQDMALKYWRKAIRQELRGQRAQGLTRYLTADVLQWIGERSDIAASGPQTAEEREAGREALLKASQESRLESLDHDLRIEQARFAAEIEQKRRQSKPQAILAIQWQ